MKQRIFLPVFALSVVAALAFTLSANAAPAKTKPAQTQTATAPVAKDNVLWDAWYTVTLNKNTPAQYYSEKVFVADKKIQIQQSIWKREEGYINEEQIAAQANAMTLEPLFFNFHSTYRSTELTVDGNVNAQRLLTVKIRKGTNELPIIRKGTPPNTMLSSFFPVWLGLNMSQFKPNTKVGFRAIPEDGIDNEFTTETGQIQLETADDFAKQNDCSRVAVDFRGMKSTWYVRPNGQAVKIVMPQLNAVIELSSKEKALSFFK